MFKRGNVYWACLMVNGRKVQRSLKTSNYKLAKKREARLKIEIEEEAIQGLDPGAGKTFDDLMDRYRREILPQRAPATSQVYEMIIKAHLLPFFGGMRLKDIRRHHVADYKSQRLGTGICGDTFNKELKIIKAALNIAVKDWEWLKENPATPIKKAPENPPRVRYLSRDERLRLFAAMPAWLVSMAIVARYTGMRRRNVLELTWQEVDLKRKVIMLDKTKGYGRLGIPMCSLLHTTLVQLHKDRHPTSELVFHRPDGSPIKGDAVKTAFARTRNRAGITDFRWHDFRHDFASALVQKGVRLYVVQQLLGHKSGRMTERYAHLSPEHLENAVKRLDEAGEDISGTEKRETA